MVFSRFLNSTNGTKLRKASLIIKEKDKMRKQSSSILRSEINGLLICDIFILRFQKCHAGGPVQLRLIWSCVTQPTSFTIPFATDAFYHEDIKWG